MTAERVVEVSDCYRLWAEVQGRSDGTPMLLVMGANSSALVWPDAFVDRLADRHLVVRYDHRDTGRSTWAFPDRPYPIRELAEDAIAVLDAFEIERAHVVGMSLGGLLVQLLLLDHAPRLRSATLFCTTSLGGGASDDRDLPGPDPRLLAMWEHMGEPRDPDAELAWRVEHWRLLNGDQLAFDPDAFRRMEQRVIEHSGRAESPTAHALADQSGLERGDELAGVTVPTLVIEAPADPINPPPHARHLAAAIPGSRLVTIPEMGHALAPGVLTTLAATIVEHTTTVDQLEVVGLGTSPAKLSGMAKQPPKGTSSRKPPEPSPSHEDIDDWMRRVMPDLQPVVQRLDELIRATHADVHYALKWKKAHYGRPDVGWMIELVAYDISVNVVFHGGADFDPPPPLGDTDRSRYVKVKTLDEAEQPELASWIEQAGKVPGWT